MAVCPGNVLPRRRAGRVEQRWLRQKHIGVCGMHAAVWRAFRLGNLFQRTAEMHRRCARTCGIRPGNRSIERIIEFEHSRSMAEALQSPTVPGRQAVADNLDQSLRRRVEQVCPGVR